MSEKASDSGERRAEDSQNERLARLETKAHYIQTSLDAMHADLRQHMHEEREIYKLHEKRMGNIEDEQTKVKTHLNWMKGIWLVLQATVIGWLKSK